MTTLDNPKLKNGKVKLLLSIHLLLFKGYYMHKEASSPRQQGDNAKLSSPPLKFFGIMCLEFYYYMSDASVGSLNVTINKTVVFSASGDSGNAWNKASINISSIVGSHMVSIIKSLMEEGNVLSGIRQEYLSTFFCPRFRV